MDVQKIIVNNLENDIEHPVNLITGPNDVDLLFNDEDYNTLVEFSDGEIKTKNFNSKKLSLVVDEYQQIATGSFGVADPSNNIAFLVKDGNILSKNFDSVEIENRISTLENRPSDNYWNGKKICILGDSITDQSYYTAVLSNELGLTVYNRGVSGCYIAKNDSRGGYDMCERVDLEENNTLNAKSSGMPSNDNVDIFMLYGGTNDWWHGTHGLGTFEASENIETFYGALKHIVCFAHNKYPRKPIILCTMLPSFNTTTDGFTDYKVNADNSLTLQTKTKADGTHTKSEYNEAIRKIAAAYGCYLLDLDKGVGLCGFTTQQAQLFYGNGDGVHPSEGYGATILGKYLANFIKTNIPRI